MAQAPTAISLQREARQLELRYADGSTLEIPVELLRVYSPSAEVRGHGSGERRLQTGKKYVGITDIEAVGNYAIRITFDDGHDTGLYTWALLEDLGRNQARYFADYERELASANASRLPTIPLGRWTPPKD